jgi:tetratricopeptide (TPR) repeat protein
MHIAGFTGAATAQTLDLRCFNLDHPDQSVRRCTAMIQSGRQTQQNLALIFNNRGIAYHLKGQPDRAIEDFDQAIRLNPNLSAAFNNRGNTSLLKNQPDRAIQPESRLRVHRSGRCPAQILRKEGPGRPRR